MRDVVLVAAKSDRQTDPDKGRIKDSRSEHDLSRGYDNLSRQKMKQKHRAIRDKSLGQKECEEIQPYGNWNSPVLPQLSRG